MSTERAELLARLALTRPEELVRMMAFRETFLARLTPQRLRTDLRNLGILFGMLVRETTFPSSLEGQARGGLADLDAAGGDLRACQQFLIDLAQGLLAAGPPGAAHRHARVLQGIADEIGRLADRLAALRPKRVRKAPGSGGANQKVDPAVAALGETGADELARPIHLAHAKGRGRRA